MLSSIVTIVLTVAVAMLAARSWFVGKIVLVTIAAWFVWSFLIYVIPIESIARSFGEFTIGTWWFRRVIYIGPPVLTGVVFAIASWRRQARR